MSNIQKAPPIVPESPCLYSEGEFTSSEENSYFKEGGNAEEKEPSSFKSGISSIVSLGPKKLVTNGEQIVKNKAPRIR